MKARNINFLKMNVDQRISRSAKSHKKSCKGKQKNNDLLKVVYISSPMKVKTSASRFRSLVQQLTGKNSDISQYMEDNNNYHARDFHDIDVDDLSLSKEASGQDRIHHSSISSDDTTTSSESFLGPIDHVFASEMEERFQGIFSSTSFYDPSELDVLGSFDEFL